MKLLRYIAVPPATEADLVREWAAIDRRSQPSAHPRRRAAFSVAMPLALAAVLAIVLLARRTPRSPLEGAVFGSDTGQAVVDLVDGSHIEVEPRARLAVVRGEPRVVRVQLQRGRALFEVAPVEGRSFEVLAHNVDVRVLGTRFRVEVAESERVHVAVERGSLELVSRESGQVLRKMVAGEEGTVEADGRSMAPDVVAEVAPASSALGIAPSTGGAEPATAPTPEPKVETSRADARQLFDAATAARRAGKNAQAAKLFDALRRRYPSNARAGLSAFELGRLRMDALGDPAGALEALSHAISASPSGSFREDAQARLVYASDAMHDGARCRSMRQAYLARYPRGVHAVTVAARCRD